MERWLDLLYLLYFGSHIPIAMFADSQAVLPRWIYPKPCLDLMDWFISEYKDNMMGGSPAWFQTFIYSEIFIQFPFFFVAFYAYWKGVSRCQWIRLPIVVYSTHVVTTLVCIYNHIFFHDCTKDETPGPRTMNERVQLASFYFPYFLVPVILLIDSLFNPVYTRKTSASSVTGPRTKSRRSNVKQQ